MGAEGTWIDGNDLVIYFPENIPTDEVELALTALLQQLADSGAPAYTPVFNWEREGEGDWVTAWQAHFTPIQVGDRLIVLPEWEDDPQGRIAVRIRPGRGFGTGGHGTTATCMERIEAHLASTPNATVLDVGTGSGILAIAAKKLGAAAVTGFDNDPDAVENARQNAALNQTDITLFTGTVDTVQEHYDLVLANLLAHVIVELMPELARVTAPHGRLILSGILNEQVDRIDTALTAHRMTAVNYTSRGMWMTVEARHG